MDIYNIQLRKAKEYILKYYLKYGRYPEWKTVSYHLYEWLQEKKPGVPLFSYTEADYKDIVSIDVIKKYLNEIREDIETLYESKENSLKETITMAVKRNLENKKERNIQNKLYEEYEIEKEILEKEEEWIDYIYESFFDLENIKSEKSNVYFDLKSNCCTLENKSNQTKWLNQKIISTKIKEKRGVEIITSPEKAIEKGETNYFVFKQSEESGLCLLEFEFEKKENINKISLNPYGFKEMIVSIYYENENGERNRITYEEKINKEKVFIFENVESKKIILEIKSIQIKNNETYLGIKEIDFFLCKYEEEGYLYFKNIKEENGIKTIMIKSSEEVKDNTSIDYEIAFYSENKNEDETAWIKINKDKKVITEKVKTGYVNLNLISVPHQKENGRVLFYLDKKEDTINKDGYLIKGVNQWKVESCFLDFDSKVPDEKNSEYSITKKEKKIYTDYLDITKKEIGDYLKTKKVLGHNHYKYTTCFFSEKEEEISIRLEFKSKELSTINNFSDYLFSCEFNEKRIETKRNIIRLKIKKGWNEIKLIIHFGLVEKKKNISIDNVPYFIYLFGLNLKKYKMKKASKDKMRKASEEDLIYRIKGNSDEFYGFENDTLFILKYEKNCRFQYVYKKESEAVKEIMIRAVLKREKDFTEKTPVINSITVYIE
jgi:hypothetical protein